MNAIRLLRLEPLLSTTSKPKSCDVQLSTGVVQEDIAGTKSGKREPGTCPYCRVEDTTPPSEYRVECEHCATIFCWVCGTQLEDEPTEYIIHLQGLETPEKARNMAWDAAVLQYVMGILIGVPSLLCGLAIAILSCAFLPCVALWELKRKHVFLLTVNLSCLVISSFCFWPILLVLVVLMLPVYPFVWAYRRYLPSDELPPKDWLFDE